MLSTHRLHIGITVSTPGSRSSSVEAAVGKGSGRQRASAPGSCPVPFRNGKVTPEAQGQLVHLVS